MGDSGQLPIGGPPDEPAPSQSLPPGVRKPDPTLGRMRPVPAPPPPKRDQPVSADHQQPKSTPTARARQGGHKARAAKRKSTVAKPRKKASVERMAAPAVSADIDPPTRPKRQRVVLADRSQAASSPSLRARVELAEQTSWGEMLIRDLIRAQLRSGVALFTLVVVLLGALPLTFAIVPSFASFTLIGIPVAWLVLGVLPFPLLFAVALWYNRLSERHERAFVDMIEN